MLNNTAEIFIKVSYKGKEYGVKRAMSLKDFFVDNISWKEQLITVLGLRLGLFGWIRLPNGFGEKYSTNEMWKLLGKKDYIRPYVKPKVLKRN